MAKLTILDIAKLSGFGKSTVSRVINGEKNVKETTKNSILKIMSEVNYTPSQTAQSLRTAKHKVIGVIGTRVDSYSEIRAFRGIINRASKYGYDAVFLESLFSREKSIEHIEILGKKGIDGLIVFAIAGEKYEFLKKYRFPVVMIGQVVDGIHSIVYDDYGSIKMVMKYLIESGKNKISFIGVDSSDYTTGYLRSKAYFDMCDLHKIEKIAVTGNLDYESGYKCAKKLYKKKRDFDAIVCATDNISLGVRKYLFEHDINVQVTGVGDRKLLNFLYSDHITVKYKYKRSGIKAVDILMKLSENSNVKIKTELSGVLKKY